MASPDLQTQAPVLLLNQSFTDMSLLGEAVDWDLDFRQIEAGKLRARAILMAGQRNMAMRVEFDRKFHQRGCPPPGILTFGFPDRKAGPLRWNSSEAMPGALLNFNNNRFEGVNPGNFGGYTLSFQQSLLAEVAQVLGIDIDFASNIQSTAFWNPLGQEHNRLRNNLRKIERSAVRESGVPLQGLGETFNFELAASVVRILGGNQEKLAKESAPFRAAALQRALSLIENPDYASLTVADLCHSVGASWATLERAFAEEFGVSPKVYLQSKRLTAVRRQLLKSEPGTVIADVANLWGFWHMGRFAANYRKQFGELPSQTLQSAA